MPIDIKVWNSPATKGEVAGLAINTAIAITQMVECLQALNEGKKIPAEALDALRTQRKDIRRIFDTLSAWTEEDGK